MATPIRRIWIQYCARLDSIVALYLLRRTREGEKRYPGVQEAEVCFWGTGTFSPDQLTWEDYLVKGELLVGVGGGPLDEHSSPDFGNRKAGGLSTTWLVARDIGVNRSPLYKRLIALVTENDLNRVPDPLALSTMVKVMSRTRPIDDVLAWTFEAIDAWVASQRQFLEAQEAFDREAVFESVDSPSGKLRIVSILSDNPQTGAAARSRCKDLAAIIQRQWSGHVQIFANEQAGVRLAKVAAELRRQELIHRGWGQVAQERRSELLSPGQLPFVPNWCYAMPGENLLNSSETAPALDRTKVPFPLIQRIVREHLIFEPTSVAV